MSAPTLPAAVFADANTVKARKSVIAITPTGGTATNLLVDYVSHNPGLEMGSYQAPGSGQNPAYTAGMWEKSRNEVFKFKTKDVTSVLTLLGSLSASKQGTAQLFIRDPNDAAAKVALLSDAFACAVYRDTAEAVFEAANPTELTLVIQSLKDGAVTLTRNADVTVS